MKNFIDDRIEKTRVKKRMTDIETKKEDHGDKLFAILVKFQIRK